MKWAEHVVEQLRAKATTHGGGTAPVEHEGWQVQVEAEATGPVGVSAQRIRVSAPHPADPAEAGRELAGRVTYLLEPLRLVEASSERALVRSAPSERWGETREYYEAWITRSGERTEIDLRRYRYTRSSRQRAPRSIDVTWEVAGRLLDDIRESLEAAQERSTASPST